LGETAVRQRNAIIHVARRSLLRHPRLAQALDHPLPITEPARIALRIGGLVLVRLPRSDCPQSGRRERKEALERFVGSSLSRSLARYIRYERPGIAIWS
jgi:hypothetical protein